ncbi:U-box domain-containing protein 34-like [Gastrolobium bilobum]|uniref:U-box domain-containing protein 34-like n=1 Tax=Gastrolobium bilobum TaxID=150636 RepID=UPI002AAF5693|nr:U-box domain-containing protein 34-like [Gastrolobium bilobum]
MSSHDGSTLPLNVTMVAVDKDKNSGHAFRWTTNHFDNSIIIAVHVKHKNNIIPHQGTNVFPPDEDDMDNVFNPLRQMCRHKVVMLKEAVIDDNDVVRGILEYAHRNHIHTIVVGAPSSTKNTLARKFKGNNVATAIIKSAPEYSSVYVISKEKIVGTRPALRPRVNGVGPPKQLTGHAPSELENGVRSQTLRVGVTSGRSERSHLHEKSRTSSSSQSMDSFDLSNRGQRSSYGHDSSSDESDSSGFASDSQSSVSGEIEAEMKRLKLQLKRTMNMYNSACKEAISAQNKAKEINQWKLEEARKVEEAKMSKEAALALAKKEKAKAKAALEAAEEAMKMAEKEAQRRLHAEMKAKREAEEKDRALTALAQNDKRYRKYTIEEIEHATQKFSPSKKIGEGGYGPVFKAQLDHTPVAIKILNPDASQGREQFQQEVEVLCSIRHPNMVLLLGACPEYGCLVYEYMENGSLEDRLLRKHNSPPIPWRKRFEIAAEIATSLLFLHQAKPEPLVHRDLKPANILLDKNFVSKISDVGLARLVPPSVADSVTQYHMTSAAGTFCYIDPQYQQTGMLTTKSDIYSLGITLMQIITAKPPMGLAHQVKRAIEKGTFSNMLDPGVTDWPVEEAVAFAKLSVSCAELSKKDRPDLASVIVPELNRLRDFGYRLHNNQNCSHSPRPPTPTRGPHSKT